ncbi:MAG: hypothetical protein ACFFDN_20735 [Candidatus Hodarchaeota archaeon]
MDELANFSNNDYLLYLLFYMCLAATGVYFIIDAIIRGRPSQRTVVGLAIWIFQLLFGSTLIFFPFYQMLIPYILKN